MKPRLFFSFLFLLLPSCNVVQMTTNHAQKNLEKIGVTAQNFTEDSLRIHYWKGGSGPTVVFIHGFGGDALVNWGKELKRFSKTNTVIAYDLLWFGKSYSNEISNLETQTEALKKLLHSLSVDSVTLVGQSYGGFIVQNFAYKNPNKVSKMIIANCPGPTFDISSLDIVCENFDVRNISDLFVFNDPNHIQRLIDAATYSNKHIPKFIRREMFEGYFTQNQDQQRLLLKSLVSKQPEMADLSIFIQIPTLVLWGEKDEIFPIIEGEKFAAEIQAQFVSIPKCGHGPQIDRHKAFLKILEESISKK